MRSTKPHEWLGDTFFFSTRNGRRAVKKKAKKDERGKASHRGKA